MLDYPDGRIAIMYGSRTLNCTVFDKLANVDQGQIVENKRLGGVLRHAKEKQDEMESQGLRERSKSMPRRRAQKRAVATMNPALTL